MDFGEEAKQFCEVLDHDLKHQWDGKECIIELKNANHQWKQMEWIGWYFEYKAYLVLRSKFGGSKGPRYGNTEFDYLKGGRVWDFKTHITNSSTHPWMILNDIEAVDLCLRDHGGVGFIIASGEASFDEDGSFKEWHDALKGGKSDYERQRIARGAPSRMRKTLFDVKSYQVVIFDRATLDRGSREEWVQRFQEGMRNADGSPRRAKYLVNVDRIPRSAVVTLRA